MEPTTTLVNEDPWHFLRYGSPQSGLALLQERYKRDSGLTEIMELGTAYLWLGKYQEADQHFEDAIKTHHIRGDILYSMAGVAMWCMDNPAAAILRWHAGLDAPYAVGGVGIRLPLLLFLASILRPGMYSRENAEKILMKTMEDPRAERWPGSLAKFVLGLDSNVEHIMTFKPWPISALEEEERKKREGADKEHREWLIRFYGHVVEFYNGILTQKQFEEFLLGASNISDKKQSNDSYFHSLMRTEEFFIARHDAQKTDSSDKFMG